MSKKIPVLLLEDVDNLGSAGAIVTVAEGYARNFLFSQGKAALADASTQEQAAKDADKASQATTAELKQHQNQAAKLDGTELTITATAKDGEDIFGSISPARVAQELSRQTDLTLKAKDITLPEKITKLGTYDITIDLSPDVEVTIKLTVIPDADSEQQNKEDA